MRTLVLDIIGATRGSVLLRQDFNGVASSSAVGRELRELCADGHLARIGLGIYAKTRKSVVTGAAIPAGSLESLATEALQRLGNQTTPGVAARAYNNRASTQLPGLVVVNTGRRRISRRLEVGGRHLHFERD